MQNLIINRNKKSLYGFNVEGFNSEAKKIIERILSKYRPSVTVYSNDYIGSQKLYDITEGESLIIHRTYQPNNVESGWNNWTANNWKDFYKLNSQSPIYQTFLNNPIIENSEDKITEYIDFVIEVLKWAMDNDYHLTFPIPDGNISWETLMTKGSFDKLLLAYDDYGFREFGHVGSVKEQIPFHINLATALSRKREGLDNLSAKTLLKYEFMQKNYWPTYEEVNITDWQSNEYLYRSVWVNKRMEQLGRKPIPTVVTEFNWADNPSFGKWTDNNTVRNIQKEIIDLYKIDPSPYPIFSGIMSLKKLYENIFKLDGNSTEPFEKTVFDQINHIQKISPDNYIGLCWYTLDPGSALRDLRAGLSYQKLLETLEPMLYKMADDLKSDTLNSENKESPLIVPIVNVINSNNSIEIIGKNTIDSSTIDIKESIKEGKESPSEDKIIPTMVIEGIKTDDKKQEDKRSSQITLKVDDKANKIDNKDLATVKSEDLPDKTISDWKAYWVSSIGMRSNIRSNPNVKSDTTGKIEEEESLYYVGKQLLEIDNLGYRWIPISEYASDKKSPMDIKGWIREDAVNLRRYDSFITSPFQL